MKFVKGSTGWGYGHSSSKVRRGSSLLLLKALKNTGIEKLKSKLSAFKDKLKDKLKMTKDQAAKLAEKLKEVIHRRDPPGNNTEKSISEINAEKKVVSKMFQGDMALSRRQVNGIIDSMDGRQKRQAFKDMTSLWNDGVFYEFDEGVDYKTKEVFKKGAKKWEDVTCINFTESKTAKDKIVLIKEDGCWSLVGRNGSEQPLSLGEGCAEYIPITEAELDTYGQPYDYDSIMHYGALSASHNGEPTMVAEDVNYQESMGSHILSFFDIYTINKHYNCFSKMMSSNYGTTVIEWLPENCENRNDKAKCENGGFPHPRDCQKCICPNGYGGDLCNKRPQGCGDALTAKETQQSLIARMGQYQSYIKDDFDMCYYWITAPTGKKVEVTINYISYGFGVDGCYDGGVELKPFKNATTSGYRFCSRNDKDKVITSEGEKMLVTIFGRAPNMQIILKYKAV
ncbi:unnamed protein product [Nippostrongylus brasiliensis]|uniref:Zinc metalloproteinase n=1 Tax=Nippostrongylus brasiliensis TaxID=27835 RepID=A0A0N4YQ52_NIPBR|nr:unnamed protein product [Nippostrongylus brasiliensis]